MGQQLSFFNTLHLKTTRNFLARMTSNKPHEMDIAQKYDFDYWDGERKFGYGGYQYDGRWQKVAHKIISHYKLSDQSKILDIGCGKAYLLYEIKKILPNIQICGTDISQYSINHAKDEIRSFLKIQKAQDPYDYPDDFFDLVFSLNVLHNLEIFDVTKALSEIERIGKNKFIVVESYRTNEELFNLQCWALTCQSFYTPEAWHWIFKHAHYSGDYEFIFFEK